MQHYGHHGPEKNGFHPGPKEGERRANTGDKRPEYCFTEGPCQFLQGKSSHLCHRHLHSRYDYDYDYVIR